MSSTPIPLVTPPAVPTTTSSVAAPPSPSPTSTTPTSSAPAPSTTPSSVSTSPVTTPSSSSSSSSSSSGTSVTPSTTGTAASSTTSSTSSTTTPPTSQSSSSSTSISYLVQTSDGQVFTLTSVVTDSSPPTQTPTNQSSNNGFFRNKGAVAGVFSVIGVVVIVLAFFLFTSYLRRRRAREFDREIDEAAAAAAAARPPDFDDYDYNSATGGYGHYSETSHGTLSQAPLALDQPRNPDGSYDPYTGVGVAGSGAAGVGARGRSLRNGGQQDPYGAFAHPPEQYEMHETGRPLQQGIPRGGTDVPNYDILQAAGLSSSDPYAVTRGPSIRTGLTYGQSLSGTSGLTRNQSQGTSTLPTTLEGYSMPVPVPTPAPVYPGTQDATYVPEKAQYAPGGGVSTMPPDLDEDAYDGYQEQPGTLNNPHSPGFSGPPAGDEHARAPHAEREEAARASFADDEDYGYTVGQRVLRVANE